MPDAPSQGWMEWNEWDECGDMLIVEWNLCRRKREKPRKNPSRLRFGHHETHMESPRREIGTPGVRGEHLITWTTEPPKGRSSTANSRTKTAVLPKGRSSTANSGTKVVVLLGMTRCGSFPLLFAHYSLFRIWTDLKRSETIPVAAAWWWEWIWLTGPSGMHWNSPQVLNMSSIRVFDRIRDPKVIAIFKFETRSDTLDFTLLRMDSLAFDVWYHFWLMLWWVKIKRTWSLWRLISTFLLPNHGWGRAAWFKLQGAPRYWGGITQRCHLHFARTFTHMP